MSAVPSPAFAVRMPFRTAGLTVLGRAGAHLAKAPPRSGRRLGQVGSVRDRT
ncbi:hypothetical protein [Streptomyces mirabilis]|uniref:hypothetical protein n=1 Tax=Streptomyces mirabilis TaxID=68239 RepID=UPI001990BB4C|nr:hypothetical protein GCM10010317_027220 [Streptomyces mirabilis]